MAARKGSAFAEHIDKISRARKKADEIIKNSASDICQEALDAAWEAVFDWLCASKASGVELADLNTAAGIIQKLASSKNALRKSPYTGPADTGQQTPRALTPEELGELEDELKLL